MQIGQLFKIKHFDPKVIFRSVRNGADQNFGQGISTTQLEHGGVPCTNVKTKKFTIGAPGVTGCNFNFTSAANTTEQVIDLGNSVVPALARILDVKTVTEVAFTPDPTTLVMETGTSSSGAELIASATIKAANAITACAHTFALSVAPNAAASHVYCSATPGANWSTITAGKVAVYITYIEV